MAGEAQVKWDQTRFDRTFKRYMQVTSRDLVTAINTKAYYVARKATWFTHKADRGKIESILGKRVTVIKTISGGRQRYRKELQLTKARDIDAPLAAVIINKRRGKKSEGGSGGLYGRDMARAIRDLLAARIRSIAYTKSGWLPSIRALAPVAEKGNAPAMDNAAKTIGRVKGSAYPAMDLHNKSAASIINEAWAKHDTTNAFYRYGASGLQRAFNDEAASMARYIQDKMMPAANEFNAAQR